MDSHSVIVKDASLSCCFEAVDIDSVDFIILLLYFHKMRCVGMNICITELQLKDALEFFPAFPCLEGLTNQEHGLGHGISTQLDVCGSVKMSVAVLGL